jgi:hypothetical protein
MNSANVKPSKLRRLHYLMKHLVVLTVKQTRVFNLEIY